MLTSTATIRFDSIRDGEMSWKLLDEDRRFWARESDSEVKNRRRGRRAIYMGWRPSKPAISACEREDARQLRVTRFGGDRTKPLYAKPGD